jgi:hypothetical protein
MEHNCWDCARYDTKFCHRTIGRGEDEQDVLIEIYRPDRVTKCEDFVEIEEDEAD